MEQEIITPEVSALMGFNLKPQASLGGAFDGADRFDRSLSLWNPSLQSADNDILPEKGTVDSRARDSLRNDAYVAGGSQLHKDNIIGSSFILNAKPQWEVLGLSEAWAEEFQREVETKFTLWAESPDNWVDASRMNTLTSMVRLAVGVYLMCGEVLASVEWIRAPGRSFNTAIQMIDLDRLRTPPGQMEGPFLRGGVSRDRFGAPQGYYITMAHPYDWNNPDSMVYKFVPARKPWGRLQMIHILEQARPDQTRGITELVSALKEIKITSKFRDIVLQNAVINATFAATIESDLPTDAVYQALGANDVGTSVSQYAQAYIGAVSQYVNSARNMHINGGKIPHLFPGTKLNLTPAGQGGPLGTEFEQSLLRYIASSLGVSYEQLSRDFTKTNYSSARAAMSETWKFMQSRKKVVADRFATAIYRLWLEEAINKGVLDSVPFGAPSFYEGMNADAYSQCDWLGASRGQIDELKETQAAALRIKSRISTYEDEAGRLGKDWRKVFAQLEREEKELSDRGLLISDDSNMINAVDAATNVDSLQKE